MWGFLKDRVFSIGFSFSFTGFHVSKSEGEGDHLGAERVDCGHLEEKAGDKSGCESDCKNNGGT